MKNKKENKIKAVFFDFDMTLVDSRSIAHASYRALLNYAQKKPTKKGFDEYVGRRVSESIAFLAHKELEKKRLIKIFLKVHEKNIKNLKIYGRETLKYLKNKKIRVIIVSNNSHKVIEKACHYHSLHFDKIIADEDIKKGWEKHEMIKEELKKMKLKKSEAFYVGDHINDIKEGKKAGVNVISVTTGVFSRKQLMKYKPFAVINDLNELKKIIS